MIEQILQLSPLFTTCSIVVIILYGMKKVTEIIKARSVMKPKKSQGIPLPDSLRDAAHQVEQALQIQVEDIGQRCKQAGVDPLKDVGYNTVLKRYQQAVAYREKFETNPMYMMFDNMVYPIIKGLIPDGMSVMKRMVKSAGV